MRSLKCLICLVLILAIFLCGFGLGSGSLRMQQVQASIAGAISEDNHAEAVATFGEGFPLREQVSRFLSSLREFVQNVLELV